MEDSTYDPIYNEEQQMNLLEFFRKYKNDIRQLLIITEGHYGLTKYDDLANDQILRVAAYTNQRRLVAKENLVHEQRKTRYLSIPVNVPYMFKVVRGHNKFEKPAKLSDIIKTHSYPIMIQFARNYSEMRVDGSNVSSNSIANLLLLKEYEENFLCYHCVDKGDMGERTNLSALSTNISCTVITGEKNMTSREFQEHLANMDYKITRTTYDRTSGNPEITRITDDGTGTGNPIPELDPPLIPQEDAVDDPGPPPPVPTRSKSKETEKSDEEEDDNYEPPPIPVDVAMQPKPPPKPRQPPLDVPQPPISSTNILPPRKQSYENTKVAVSPMPKPQEADTNEYSEPDMTEDEYLSYTEMHKDDQSDKNNAEGSEEISGTKSTESSIESPTREWLDNLSISGVSDVLRQLRLDNYVDKFQKDMVSGSILGEYDEDLLKEEYNFKRVESIRLMKFVRTGHIPK